MLSQFTVKNFKSFREEMTLDMQAAAITEHTDKVIKINNGEELIPISIIYGPNGGGKSNVLLALQSLIEKVIRPLYATETDPTRNLRLKNVEITPFVFDNYSCSSPTEYELFFRTHKAEYRYIIKVFSDIVIFEKLDMVKLETNRISALFKRDKESIELKGTLGKIKVNGDISEKLPLLSYLGIAYRKNDTINDCISWFENKVEFLNYGNLSQELRLAMANSAEYKNLILDMIREMDLDIEGFRTERPEPGNVKVYTRHKVGDSVYEIGLDDESSGTKKVFGLLPFIANSLTAGTTLVIDELDAKIHPVLLKHIITLYTDMNVNKHGAQLIFTSHDLSTMSSEYLRRDEIWFVAKGSEQNSKLYSLVEFKNSNGISVRKDARFDKQYLEGKYGADPYLRKIIDWSVI